MISLLSHGSRAFELVCSSRDSVGLCSVLLFRSRTRGPIGPGKYGYGKAPYILPLQTDTTHTPQRLRRQRPSSRHSRSQEASASKQGYRPPTHQFSHSQPLYQSDSGPRSGLPPSEASIYQLPLTHDQSYPAASSLFHRPELSSHHGARPHGAAQAFPQHLRSTAISCIGAYRQYKLCNTNVSTQHLRLGLEAADFLNSCSVDTHYLEDRGGSCQQTFYLFSLSSSRLPRGE